MPMTKRQYQALNDIAPDGKWMPSLSGRCLLLSMVAQLTKRYWSGFS